MRLLVLGGTVFVSKAVARAALARGHDVVCACRGTSGTVPDGATLLVVDRSDPSLDLAADVDRVIGEVDAVVEVSRTPSHVRAAVAALPGPHWVFVSSISVYADHSTPHGSPASTPLLDPEPDDLDPLSSPETYGAMKVACEDTVLAGASSATVVRPGLIIGPGDPTGRFSYWPRRLSLVAEHPEVLAPGDPTDTVQVLDARDLAEWIVTCAERRTAGVFDATGPVVPLGEMLASCAEGIGVDPLWTWVDQDFLTAHGVEPWAGPDAVPLWLPRPEYDRMLSHDPQPASAAGLVTRPLADTARDVGAWLAATPDAEISGISRDREAELLSEWHVKATGALS